MVYKIVSVICDDINKGFSIAYAELQYQGGSWQADNFILSRYEYTAEWKKILPALTALPAIEYIDNHNALGKFLSEAIKKFITTNHLEFKVQLIALKGFEAIANNEAGSPSQIAALTGINVVADFKGIDTALNGNGRYDDSVAASLLTGKEPEVRLALLAVLRWREENNFLGEKTGAQRNSINGAVWMGQEA